MAPMKNEIMSVIEVMVMLTAASAKVCAILSATESWSLVRRQAASITKVSSMPMPAGRGRGRHE